MKNLLGLVFAVAITMAFPVLASADDYYRILDVDVFPENPSATDQITFDIFLRTGYTPGWVEQEQFFQNGTSLQLDLDIKWGMFTAIDEWTYSKNIGCLESGDYSLTVRYLAYGMLLDTHVTEFTVIPEPVTLVFLAVGLPVFRSLTSRRRVKAMAT